MEIHGIYSEFSSKTKCISWVYNFDFYREGIYIHMCDREMYCTRGTCVCMHLCLDDGLKTVLKVVHSTVQYLWELLHHPLVNAVVVGT